MSRKKIVNKRNFFGERLKTFRKSNNLTQQDLAKSLNTSSGQISEIETGQKMPGGGFLISLLRYYNINVNWLLTGEGEPTLRETLGPPPTLCGQLQRPGQKSAAINNEGDEERWDETSLGKAVDQLRKIFDSGDHTLIRAINANLDAFTRTVDLADEVKSLKTRVAVMEANMKRMENIIDELGRRETCCVHAVTGEGDPPGGDPSA